ncbi:MAG: NUDIX domain-containing protein [Methanomassiliicoccus sp.]|nr:NUDIX domain-containing protein [Methanomassiliicoccus sp.]
MRYVYGIAFRGEEFIMVFNPRRGGWEMPGGKIEEGESDLQAMVREFREEVGWEFVAVASTDVEGVSVFAGELGGPAPSGEMEWKAFRELPERLSFPLVEYMPLIAWGREAVERHRALQAGSATA